MATKKPDVWLDELGDEHGTEAAADAVDDRLSWARAFVAQRYQLRSDKALEKRARIIAAALTAFEAEEGAPEAQPALALDDDVHDAAA